MRPALRQGLLAAGAALFLLVAVALAALAFTRFDNGTPPPEGSPEVREWNEMLYRDAQAGALLGVGAAFSLLACFACGQAFQRGRRRPG